MSQNISIKIDLMKLVSVETSMKGQSGNPVKGIFIPYEPNHVYVGEKGRYLDLQAFELKNPRQDSKDTHMIKVDLKKEIRDAMTEEERNSQPIVGNAILWGSKPESKPAPSNITPTEEVMPEGDDLPF